MPSRHSTCPWKGGDGNADGQSSELWSEQPTRRSFIYCIPLHCTVDGVAALVLAHLCRSTQRDRQANQDEQDDRQPTGGEMLQSVVHFVKHECRRGLLSPCQFGTEREIPHSYTGLLFILSMDVYFILCVDEDGKNVKISSWTSNYSVSIEWLAL